MPFDVLMIYGFKCLPLQQTPALGWFYAFASQLADLQYRDQNGLSLGICRQEESLAGLRHSTGAGGTVALDKQRIAPVALHCLQKGIKITMLIHAFTSVSFHLKK